MKRLLVFLFCAIVVTLSAKAQIVTGAIAGAVTDPRQMQFALRFYF